PAKSADKADDTPDRAHMIGIIDGNVLVDGRLSEAHEKAEHENQYGEGEEPGFQAEGNRPAHAADHVLRRRIRQQKCASDGHAEGPVHDAARPVLVGQMAAVDPEYRSRDGVEGANHAGGGDVEAVDADQIPREPKCQRNERAEDEEIVERKPPDLQVFEWRDEAEHWLGLDAGFAPRLELRLILGEDPEENADDGQGDRPDVGDGLPAISDHDEGCHEFRYGGAN